MALQNSGHPERSEGPRKFRMRQRSKFVRSLAALGMNPIENALQRSAKILEAIETFFDDVDARRVAQANGRIIVEIVPRNNVDICLTQKAVGKILRSQPDLTDVYQNVKRTLWF